MHKKNFIHYFRVSVSKGLQTELCTSELMLRKFDDKTFQTYCFCHCTIEIKRAFTQGVNTCNYCLKLLENEDQDNPRIDIIWRENKKYGVFAKFHRSFVDRVFRYENIRDKSGKISQKIIEKHINACDESQWVTL